MGQVCRLSGSGGAPGKPPRFSLTAQATARITEIIGRLHDGQQVPIKKTWIFGATPPPLGDYAAPLLQVRVAAVEPDMAPPDDVPVDTFRAALLSSLAEGALAGELGGKARFHYLVLSASENYPQMATFALRHLPMDAAERADLSAEDFAPRVRALLAKLG